MYNEFHQHPDGLVYVRITDGRFYCDTRSNFVKDFNVELYDLPSHINEHIYTQNKRHAFMSEGNVVEGGNLPDPYCDMVIAKFETGMKNKAARIVRELAAASQVVQDAYEDEPDDVEILIDTLISEGIIPESKRGRVTTGFNTRREARRMAVNEKLKGA